MKDSAYTEGKKYCRSLTAYQRFHTREVMVGNVGIGGDNPIRIQSMTTVDTMDTHGSVEECIRMIESGCEIIRITAPSKKEAENLQHIKDELRKRGYTTPLVADIHFTPNAAEIAARIVEKVRVNPGNYADKKKFEQIEYTDESYEAELERIREKFSPLVEICKEHGTAMRIGTNHGSLSDRIMSRYGDSPMGMVESAMEFLRICWELDFHEIVISMKSSNTQVMVQAYRLLVTKMMEEGMNYPLHLGVTEAGEGEDGRIKSAVGIGTLLEDGLGDTIRVSLTEAPEYEAPVAKMLAERYEHRSGHGEIQKLNWEQISHLDHFDPFSFSKRKSRTVKNIGGKQVPRVIADLSDRGEIKPASLFGVGYQYSVPLDKWNFTDMACDYIFAGNKTIDFEVPESLGIIYDHKTWLEQERRNAFPMIPAGDWNSGMRKSEELNFIIGNPSELTKILNELGDSEVLILKTQNGHGMAEQRRFFFELENREIDLPVIVQRTYKDLEEERFQLYSATDLGALQIDGFGDGIWIGAEKSASLQSVNQAAFGILQACRSRISKTEYISCPSCGRTLFDLQETTAKIRNRTSHLKGVKIGIMGCIVNGPGEMADADYGYVGTGPGKITLYKEQTVVKKNVPESEAVEELIGLIQTHGDWKEPG